MDIASLLNARTSAPNQGLVALTGGEAVSLEGMVPPETGAAFDRLLEGFLLGTSTGLTTKEGQATGKRLMAGGAVQSGDALWSKAGLVALPTEMDVEASPLSREIVAFLNELSELVTEDVPADQDAAVTEIEGEDLPEAAVESVSALPQPTVPTAPLIAIATAASGDTSSDVAATIDAAAGLAPAAPVLDPTAPQTSVPQPRPAAPDVPVLPTQGQDMAGLQDEAAATDIGATAKSAPFMAALSAAAEGEMTAEVSLRPVEASGGRQGVIPLPFSDHMPDSAMPPMPIIGLSASAASASAAMARPAGDKPAAEAKTAMIAPSPAAVSPDGAAAVTAAPAEAVALTTAPPKAPSAPVTLRQVPQPGEPAPTPDVEVTANTDGEGAVTVALDQAEEPVVVKLTRATAPARNSGESGPAASAPMTPAPTEDEAATPFTVATEAETAGEHVTNKRMLAPKHNDRDQSPVEAGAVSGPAVPTQRPTADAVVPRPEGVRDALLARAVSAPAEAGSAGDDGTGSGFADGTGSSASPLSAAHAGDAKVQASDFAQHLRQPIGGRPGQVMPVPHQVAVQVQKAAQDGTDRLSIQLRPLELGRIDIQLDFSAEGTLRARVTADSAQTLDMLQKDAKGLERALEEAGLSVESNGLSFSLRDSGDQAQRGHEREQDRGSGTKNASNAIEEDVQATTAQYVPIIGPDRVDVRI